MIKGVLVGFYFSYILFYIGKNSFHSKLKYNKRILFIQLLYTLFYAINGYNSGILKSLIEMLLIIFYFKLIFKENWFITVCSGIIFYSFRYFIEIMFQILDVTLFYQYKIMNFLKKHIVFYCIFTGTLCLLILQLIGDKIIKLLKSIQLYSIKYILILIVLFLDVVFLVFLKEKFHIHSENSIIIAHTIVIICGLFVFGYLIIQTIKVKKISNKYLETIKYFDSVEELLEEYRYILHENKNQLLVIRGMLQNNTEAEEYINRLLNSRSNLKYEWVCDLKNIPIPGLKGLVNYKVAEMKKLDLKVEIYIDDALGKMRVKHLTEVEYDALYSIIGIFLDNAMEAAVTSEKKMVSIQCYKKENQIHLMIANTYSGEIDLEKINEFGYSSKGKNRGIGLPLVKKLVEENPIYSNNVELFDIFFVQNLYVNLPNNT